MIALIVLLSHFDLRYNKQCDSFKDSAKVATSIEHIKKKISPIWNKIFWEIEYKWGQGRKVETWVICFLLRILMQWISSPAVDWNHMRGLFFPHKSTVPAP